jgi:hypothetical protein
MTPLGSFHRAHRQTARKSLPDSDSPIMAGNPSPIGAVYPMPIARLGVLRATPASKLGSFKGNTIFMSAASSPVSTAPGPNAIALSPCQVTGSGSSATLSCGQPVVVATSSQCFISDGKCVFFSVLDKDFMSIDPRRGKLYVSYTEFGFQEAEANAIELAVCDLTSNPVHPDCSNGSRQAPAAPYLIVAPTDNNFCENEGVYPRWTWPPGMLHRLRAQLAESIRLWSLRH